MREWSRSRAGAASVKGVAFAFFIVCMLSLSPALDGVAVNESQPDVRAGSTNHVQDRSASRTGINDAASRGHDPSPSMNDPKNDPGILLPISDQTGVELSPSGGPKPLATILSDGFEYGSQGGSPTASPFNGWYNYYIGGSGGSDSDWEHGAPSGAGAPSPHGGSYVWKTGIYANYPAVGPKDYALESPSMSLAGYVSAQLTYWQWYQFESSTQQWDCGRVEVSADGGAWTAITPSGGYPGTCNQNINSALYGLATFTSYVATWTQQTFDLSAYNGVSSLKIRFHMAIDDNSNDVGWAVDDFLVTATASGNQPPATPTLSTPWDFQKGGEWASPLKPVFTFSTTDPESNAVRYNIIVSTDPNFGSSVINAVSGTDAGFSAGDPYVSGATVTFTVQNNLTSGTTYWWKVRAKDPLGSNSYSSFSSTRSLTLDSSLLEQRWFQTTKEQFDRDTLVPNAQSITYGGGAVNVTSATGSATSTSLTYASGPSAKYSWDAVTWTKDVTYGSITLAVQKFTSSWVWTGIQGSSSPISVASLTTTSQIRLVANLTYSGGSPLLLDWEISWQIRIPTLKYPFDNGRGGDLTANALRPKFNFSMVDPGGNSLTYQILISSTYDFSTIVVNAKSNETAGWLDETNPADLDPFASGDTVKFEPQSDLTSGTTYWWKVRAIDRLGGTPAWSSYSYLRSYTAYSPATNVDWYQTTKEQLQTDTTTNTWVSGNGGGEARFPVNVTPNAPGFEGTGVGSTPAYRDTTTVRGAWPTAGSYSFRFAANSGACTVGSFGNLTQRVNLTGVTYITFDLYLVTQSQYSSFVFQVFIDYNWASYVYVWTQLAYVNQRLTAQSAGALSYTDYHNVTFRMYCNTGNSMEIGTYIYLDNVAPAGIFSEPSFEGGLGIWSYTEVGSSGYFTGVRTSAAQTAWPTGGTGGSFRFTAATDASVGWYGSLSQWVDLTSVGAITFDILTDCEGATSYWRLYVVIDGKDSVYSYRIPAWSDEVYSDQTTSGLTYSGYHTVEWRFYTYTSYTGTPRMWFNIDDITPSAKFTNPSFDSVIGIEWAAGWFNGRFNATRTTEIRGGGGWPTSGTTSFRMNSMLGPVTAGWYAEIFQYVNMTGVSTITYDYWGYSGGATVLFQYIVRIDDTTNLDTISQVLDGVTTNRQITGLSYTGMHKIAFRLYCSTTNIFAGVRNLYIDNIRPTATFANPSFEESFNGEWQFKSSGPSGVWEFKFTHDTAFTGTRTTGWFSEGAQSYLISNQAFISIAVGQYAMVTQLMDLSGVSKVRFDLKAYTTGSASVFRYRVLVDGNIVYDRDQIPSENVVYTNQDTSVLNYPGPRRLSFQLYCDAANVNIGIRNMYIDNVRLIYAGNVTSTAINFADGPIQVGWQYVNWSKDTAQGAMTVAVQKWTGTAWAWTGLQGSTSVTGLDITSLGTQSKIRLFANMTPGTSGVPRLLDWRVRWIPNTPPVLNNLDIQIDGISQGDNSIVPANKVVDFVMNVTDAQGSIDVTSADLKLNGTDDYKLRWTRSPDAFSIVAGGACITLYSNDQFSNATGNKWTLRFRIKFAWTCTIVDTNYDPIGYSVDSKGAAATRTFQDRTYRIEDDLMLRDNGLVAYYKLDDAGGQATDSSGLGNTGTLVNSPTWTTGKVGGGLSFNGSNDRVSIPTSSSLNLTVFTVMLWVYPKATNTNFQPLVVKEASDGTARNYGLFIAPNTMKLHFSFQAGDCTTWRSYTGSLWMGTSAWNHVAMTYDGSNFKLYRNGTLDTNASLSSTVCLSNNPVKLGKELSTYGDFNGTMDEVRIYNRALSSTEVTEQSNLIYRDGVRGQGQYQGTLTSGTTWVRGSEQITFSGVSVCYEGTSYSPVDADFDITIHDDDTHLWTQATGSSLNLAVTADPVDDPIETYYINVTNVPGSGTHGTRTFVVKVDASSPTINYNSVTSYGPYVSDPGVNVNVDFFDNSPSSGLKQVEYTYPNNGTSWTTLWGSLNGATSKDDNFDLWDSAFIGDNLVQFRVTDMVGNVKTESTLHYIVTGTTGPLSLYYGVNVISIKVTMGYFGAFQLGKEIKAKTGRTPIEITHWNLNTQAWDDSAMSIDGVTWYGNNMTVQKGESYLVRITGSGSWPVSYGMFGKRISSPVNLSIASGISFVAIPYTTSRSYKAWDDDGGGGFYGLADVIATQNAGKQVYEVSWWNQSQGAFEVCAYTFGTWSCPDSWNNNFRILPGIGYLVKTGGTGTWPATFKPDG